MRPLMPLLLAGLLLATGCRQSQPRTPAADGRKAPMPVEAVVAARAPLARVISASGVAAGIQEAYVVSLGQGTIRSVDFRLGQYVYKGQTLMQLDNAIFQPAYESAAKQDSMARIYLRATQKLYDGGNASQMELADAQSKATGAQAGLENARRNLENCRVSAPISGYIAQKELVAVAGGAVAGGTLVGRVVDLSALKTTVPVGEMEVGMLRPGLAAQVRVPAAGNAVFAGSVSAIGAGANPATGSYPVEVTWKNTAQRTVKSGMSVSVQVPTASADSVVMVPLASLTQRDRKPAVFVAAAGAAALRFVETGRTTDLMAEVVRGVSAGDTVLTSGTTTLNVGDSLALTVKP